MKSRPMFWLFWPVATIATLIVNVLFGLSLLTKRSSKTIARINRFWGRTLLRGAGVVMLEEGHIPADGGPFIIVSNHSSILDIPAVLAALGVDFRLGSLPKFFRVPLLGSAMKMADHFAIDPGAPFGSVRTLRSRSVKNRFDKGQSVMIFPEGTRSKDGAIGDFHRGAFSAAIFHKVPVLPVRLWGLNEALPKGSFKPRSTVAAVSIGEPISTVGLKPKDSRALSLKVRQLIIEAEPPPSYKVSEKAAYRVLT